MSDIDMGMLVPVLEPSNAEDIELIHAIFAGHKHLAARIRAFLDFLLDEISQQVAGLLRKLSR